MPSLALKNAQGAVVQSFPLTRRITSIGAAKSNDIVLDAEGVDASHALIQFDGTNFSFQSISAGAASLINGRRARREQLKHNAELQLGQAQLTFHLFDIPEIDPSRGSPKERAQNYEQLLHFAEELLHEHDVDALLERMMDLIVELTGAEKGFLLLRNDDDSLGVRVARAMDRAALGDGSQLYSDSIVRAVIESRSALIVSDALQDDAFRSSHSVVNFRLCSVLCAPLLYKGELFGLIYLGNDNVVNLFHEGHKDALTIFSATAALIVRNALMLQSAREDNRALLEALETRRFGSIIGASDAMQAIFRQVERIAPTDITVLIGGETGTGKELIARELHERSPRAGAPFISINCGAIPEALLESELFGHVRGAFTGANQARIGKFQAASGGTLFLDEIGEMPLNLQVKILRAIQERVVTRVGEHRDEPIDIRVVAASNRDLQEEVRAGNFREDLYYRLNVMELTLPPLRERGDDVLLIAQFLLDRYVEDYKSPRRRFGADAKQALLRYTWPGNIRQLENHIKKAVVLAEDTTLRPEDLSLENVEKRSIEPLQNARDAWQRAYVQNAIELCDGNRTQAAKELGVDPRTIYRYLREDEPTSS